MKIKIEGPYCPGSYYGSGHVVMRIRGHSPDELELIEDNGFCRIYRARWTLSPGSYRWVYFASPPGISQAGEFIVTPQGRIEGDIGRYHVVPDDLLSKA